MGRPAAEIISSLKSFKKSIGEKYKIKEMILFGSAARGRLKEDSDIDLILVSESFNGKSAIKRASPLYLAWNLDYPVDFLCYTPQEFERLKKVSIVSQALKEGVAI